MVKDFEDLNFLPIIRTTRICVEKDRAGATGYAYFTICYSKLLTHRNVYGGEVGRDIYICIYSNESFFFFHSASLRIIRLEKTIYNIFCSIRE